MPRAKKRVRSEPKVEAKSYHLALGEEIRRRRLARDLSQADLATKVGISLKYLGELERGTGNPSADVIGRLAAALDWDGLSAFRSAREPLSDAEVALRDEFARMVLPLAIDNFYDDGDAWDSHDDIAEHCYNIADAMLRARQK